MTTDGKNGSSSQDRRAVRRNDLAVENLTQLSTCEIRFQIKVLHFELQTAYKLLQILDIALAVNAL